jgi:hypothetical protein
LPLHLELLLVHLEPLLDLLELLLVHPEPLLVHLEPLLVHPELLLVHLEPLLDLLQLLLVHLELLLELKAKLFLEPPPLLKPHLHLNHRLFQPLPLFLFPQCAVTPSSKSANNAIQELETLQELHAAILTVNTRESTKNVVLPQELATNSPDAEEQSPDSVDLLLSRDPTPDASSQEPPKENVTEVEFANKQKAHSFWIFPLLSSFVFPIPFYKNINL